jgi:uncharacterized protein YndB with AHSA1/START domain
VSKSSSTRPAGSDRELAATRTFDAPRDLVFRLFTEPEHITHWWGPRGFSTTTSVMDVRPGGVWRHVMHGPDGVDYPNEVIYREVVRPERLRYDHISAPRFQMTVTFEEVGERTRVHFRMVFESAAARDAAVEEYGADKGLRELLERLGEVLARLSATGSPG